mmetsp:Transcript_23742/g.35368  ORF Transcript_23742/g.35368 Transcript_23742/m.35368 type:complete len:192 (-) Transcript_23742:175-750(-)
MAAATTQTLPLSSIYPINTLMELTLNNNNSKEVTTGTIYCTDEVSNTIVLKKSLVHTTLTSEITVINAAVVTDRRIITPAAEDEKEGEKTVLPNVSRRMVEERERRAIKLMEESFSHVNQQASPEGQKIFDKLLKACNEVSWRGESIIVLGEIRVDPPYTSNDCVLIGKGGGLDGHSLERVKNIVNAAAVK